jgi:hypothetical protein
MTIDDLLFWLDAAAGVSHPAGEHDRAMGDAAKVARRNMR